MFQPATNDKSVYYTKNSIEENKKAAKYHQAAFSYFLIGIVYLIVFFVTMPPHDFSGLLEDFVNENMQVVDNYLKGLDYSVILNTMAVTAGTLFLGLSYFIYKGFRILTMVLAVIYAIRFILALTAFFTEEIFVAIPYVLPLIAFTFYMLARAAWDLKP